MEVWSQPLPHLVMCVYIIHVNERRRRREERSKQGQTNNKEKQHSTHMQGSHMYMIVNERRRRKEENTLKGESLGMRLNKSRVQVQWRYPANHI